MFPFFQHPACFLREVNTPGKAFKKFEIKPVYGLCNSKDIFCGHVKACFLIMIIL